MFYVYVLKSVGSHRLYVGRTADLRERIRQHFAGKCWTTMRMRPFKLVFYEGYLSENDSIRRENYFKTSKGKQSLKQIIRNSLRI